jgi:hypothetical protein
MFRNLANIFRFLNSALNFAIESTLLDHLRLEAARIVTGLPIFASSILIYKELGWESLAERTISLTIHPALPNRDQSQFLSVIHHG